MRRKLIKNGNNKKKRERYRRNEHEDYQQEEISVLQLEKLIEKVENI